MNNINLLGCTHASDKCGTRKTVHLIMTISYNRIASIHFHVLNVMNVAIHVLVDSPTT